MAISGMREAVAAVRHYQARVTDMQYPKSLGEECLDFWADRILRFAVHGRYFNKGKGTRLRRVGVKWTYGPGEWPLSLVVHPEDFRALRRAMWHRNGAGA